MTKIGLLSDTHGFFDPQILEHFRNCDAVWHAGDWGDAAVAEQLKQLPAREIRGVFGNIDGQDIRTLYPEQLVFSCESVTVMIRHIGGYPPRYNPETKKQLLLHRPQLFIAGHSHILKVMYDDRLQCLHMNPGAAGRQGWHTVRTLLRFEIDGSDIRNCEVIELGSRSGR
ncbi:MAG: metallophosphoesterase family protein [Lacibacter sp.]